MCYEPETIRSIIRKLERDIAKVKRELEPGNNPG